ncbi:MAG: malto-oligosyltrehalose synthase [Candidatus Riflebacteria bacterium HGW-Riflebacteria-1]|jgi:(1->4)-alpha-D-glucan 1-alpha-D-glucosylmutase|nr:MAG: malto-oligosyltrehalose synthase [Candidatus Riflebacteria bacterium HGW-Riflebacteria-1]
MVMKFFPRATYRLQMHSRFNFAMLGEHIEYLHRLGISHLYLSPCLQAVPGSMHGYDVVDHSHINTELGGNYGFDRIAKMLSEKNMSIILDIVPNHMAVRCPENPWWWDVLENGPSSQFARCFDVDWHTESDHFSNLILLPVLGDHYGIALEAGELKVEHEKGKFTLHYFDNVFPMAPRSLQMILELAYQNSGIDELGYLAGALHVLPHASSRDIERIRRRQRDKAVIYEMLNTMCKEVAGFDKAITAAVVEINQNHDKLDELIGHQNYKLAYWKLSKYQVGYRRFFNINSLVGLCMEEDQAFCDTHRLVFELEKIGKVDGFRVDHPDGLFEPTSYFNRLRKACPEAIIVAEKILEQNEPLNAEWPVSGTTGYDFLNLVNGLFIDKTGYEKLLQVWHEFIGEQPDYQELVYRSKKQTIKNLLGSEAARLAADLAQICENHRRYRDFAQQQLYGALVEVAAGLDVYRTYIQPESGKITKNDQVVIGEAIARAKIRQPQLGSYIFDFIAELLLLKLQGEKESLFVRRFQQFTGPVMAKSLEDTVFYIFNPLVSLNEVGGNPDAPVVTVKSFHKWCLHISKNWPLTMLTSSTHDTKRSEDVRARLNLLSEIPDSWAVIAKKWQRMNAGFRSAGAPDANTEYLLYQTLVGTWPVEKERIAQYMEKAVREAKTHSSWAEPDQKFEAALLGFIDKLYSSPEFIKSLEDFVDDLIEPGQINSLLQLTIKLTAPGFPDIYQGSEIWNNSLTDPDNRRPVDFAQNFELLKKLENKNFRDVMHEPHQGSAKLFIIKALLALRAKVPAFNEPDSYRAVDVMGTHSDDLLAYMRGSSVIVLVPRLSLTRKDRWDGTRIILPQGRWQNIFTGQQLAAGSNKVKDLLKDFPAAVIVDMQQIEG